MRTPILNGSYKRTIRSDLAEARRVQSDIEQMLEKHQFEERDIFGIKLALEEAMVNAIKHGNQMNPQKNVHIEYGVKADRFHIRIVDEGAGFDPSHVPDPMADENLERPCGRGLLLMRHYMCEVRFDPPGNIISMSKFRKNGRPSSNGK